MTKKTSPTSIPITYLALLRGINVGGNNKIGMKPLKALFEAIGFDNVTTYINSGNVLFDTSKSVDITMIESAIEKEFNLNIPIVIRTESDIQQLVKHIPTDWNNAEQRTDILFLWKQFDSKKSLELLTVNDGVDHVKYVPGAIIWNFNRDNYNKTGMRQFIGTALYKGSTVRNVNTVRKLAELMKSPII